MRRMKVLVLAVFLTVMGGTPLLPSLVSPTTIGEAQAQVRRRAVVVTRPRAVVVTGPRVVVRRSYGMYYGIGGVIAFLVILGIVGYFLGWWGGYVVVDSPVVVDPGVVVVDPGPVVVSSDCGVIVDADCAGDCDCGGDCDCSGDCDCGGGDW